MRRPIWKRGSELHEKDQADVLRAYIYRNTIQNPRGAKLTGSTEDPINDSDWLFEKAFHVRKDGRLDRRVRGCMSASIALMGMRDELQTKLEAEALH